MSKDKDLKAQMIFLGRRWPDSAPLDGSASQSAWMRHYAEHTSFPVPAGQGPDRQGCGVLIVDAADFTAVQTSHSYRGDWLILAFLPDMYGIRDQYEVRLRQEALAYGGLRDLELRAVAHPDEIRAVFVLDTPGWEADEEELLLLARAAWELRESLEEPLRSSPRWPARCRTLGVSREEDAGDSGPAVWERVPQPAPGDVLPPAADLAAGNVRLASPSEATMYRAGETWLAVGRPRPLADFLACAIYYQSLLVMTGKAEPAWPEPGDSDPGAPARFLARIGKKPRAKTGSGGDYFASLLKRAKKPPVKIPADLPDHVRAWLGQNKPGRDD